MEIQAEALISAIANLGQMTWVDYVQIIASLISILVSGWAVVMAIKIPRDIAEKQNKIALFEKRFAAYKVLQKYVLVAMRIEEMQEQGEDELYMSWIARIFFDGDFKVFEVWAATDEIEKQSAALEHIPFLFEGINELEIGDMKLSMIYFVQALEAGSEDVEELKGIYLHIVNSFYEAHIEDILDALQLEDMHEPTASKKCLRKK